MTLKQWRGAMSKAELAELLGVSLSTVKRWENGEVRIPHAIRLLIKLTQPGQLQEFKP